MKPANFPGRKVRRQFDARWRLETQPRALNEREQVEVAVLDNRIPAGYVRQPTDVRIRMGKEARHV